MGPSEIELKPLDQCFEPAVVAQVVPAGLGAEKHEPPGALVERLLQHLEPKVEIA